MAAGALWALAVVWGGQKLSVGFLLLPMVLPVALVVPGLVMLAMIARLAQRRELPLATFRCKSLRMNNRSTDLADDDAGGDVGEFRGVRHRQTDRVRGCRRRDHGVAAVPGPPAAELPRDLRRGPDWH